MKQVNGLNSLGGLCFVVWLGVAQMATLGSSFSVEKKNNKQRLLSAPLVMLDRDGVINEDVGAPGVLSVDQLVLTREAGVAIGKLKQAGCHVVMITNQSCVGKGLIHVSELEDIQSTLQRMLLDQDEAAVIDKIYCCTARKEDEDLRMKPHPGMIHEALHDFGEPPTTDRNNNKNDVFFVGDTITDMQAAAAADVSNRILVSTGYGLDIMNGQEAVISSSSASSFPSKYVISQTTTQGAGSSTSSASNNNLPPEILPFNYCKDLNHAVSEILLAIA